MSLKNIFALRDETLAAFSHVYPFAHIPIDRILLDRLAIYGAPPLSARWSRLTDYNRYLDYQRWVRERFSCLPLDVELRAYRGDDVQNYLAHAQSQKDTRS